MNSKKEPIRAFGQRSIASTFVFRSTNPAKDSKYEGNFKDSRTNSRVSLSDFLDRKLCRPSEPPRKVPGKSMPFSTLLNPKGATDPMAKEVAIKRVGHKEADPGLSKVSFEQFKHLITEKVDPVKTCSANEGENFNPDDMQDLKKRRNPFECCRDPQPAVRKHVIVMGDDPKPRGPDSEQRRGSSMRNKKPRSAYNHYASGNGWWNDDMEGVDNEELGFNEVWEGVGSTTLGGIIDWH